MAAHTPTTTDVGVTAEQIRIRPGRPAEAANLGELALRSKAHWGYDHAFLAACRAELIFEPADVRARRIQVAELDGRVVGFYSLDGWPPEGEIGNMWVEPSVIGFGIGRRLWLDAIARATATGFEVVRIGAEPHAEGFYKAMGAVRVGETPSGSIPGRMLPMLQYRVTG